MNKLEDRLHAAADETRRLAARKAPPRLDEKPVTGRPGLLVFVAAFAIVLAIFGLVPLLMNGPDGPPTADSAPLTTLATPPTTVPTTMGTAPADSSCSAAEVPAPGVAEDLPEPVSATRNAMVAAAMACDFTTLESLAGENFTTSFGGGGAENLSRWEDESRGELDTLLNLLDMSHGIVRVEDGADIYVWPAAHAHEWPEVTEEHLDELGRIYTAAELDEFAAAGSYLGWRTGIDQDGNWLYFVAGD